MPKNVTHQGRPIKTIASKTGVRQFVKEMRSKYESRPHVTFLLQDWEDSYNVGSLFRTAEALGVDELVMTGRTPCPPDDPMIPVTSMGAHRRVAFRTFERHEEAARVLKDEGWTLIALEVADGAVDIAEFTFPEKTCLVLGNEGGGVYGSMMKLVDAAVAIPMMGKGRSLNVSVAAAVAAYAALVSDPAENA